MAKVSGRKPYYMQPQKTAGIPVLVFRGLIVSLLVSLISIVFLTVITLISDSVFLEEYNQYVMIAVAMLSIFTGSAFATRKAQSKALLIGAAVGCVYILLSVGIGLELSNDAIAVSVLVNKFLAGIAAGALGGIAGINL